MPSKNWDRVRREDQWIHNVTAGEDLASSRRPKSPPAHPGELSMRRMRRAELLGLTLMTYEHLVKAGYQTPAEINRLLAIYSQQEPPASEQLRLRQHGAAMRAQYLPPAPGPA